jgi:hypothetical protein
MSKRICYPRTSTPIVTGNLQVDSRVNGRKKKVLVPGQVPATGPAQPFGPQLPGVAAPAIPVPADGFSKTITVTRTPAGAPRLKYEDITGTATRHHIGKGASLAPKMPAATTLGRVHRARKGAGVTRRTNR